MLAEDVSNRLEMLGLIPLAEPEVLKGGDIAAVWTLDTAQGRVIIKQDDATRLAGEAEGLRVLRQATRRLVVPEVLGLDGDLLVMEWLDTRAASAEAEHALGEGLRELHSVRYDTHGWEHDNACGLTPQVNTPCADGRVFQRECRLLPLGEACARQGLLSHHCLDALTHLAHRLEQWLPDTPPCLVHGDLWSGNVLQTSRGPAIIDPAIYRHYGEVDLAMLMLFGSPSEAFFEAYWDGRRPADWPRRQTLFQLYPLLNHLLLFGSGYRGAVERAISELS